jgi:peroxiredoxin
MSANGVTMSMQEQAAAIKDNAQDRLGEKFSLLAGDIDRVNNSGVLGRALTVGQQAPGFTLPDAFGNSVSSAHLLSKGPLVISFYRGEWCPFCNLELRSLEQALPTFQALGASLIAITPEKPDHSIVATEKNKLTFPILSDFSNQVAHQFGIVFQLGQDLKDFSLNVFKNDIAVRNGESSYELPVPATFVLDTAGIIRFAHVDANYMTGRAEPDALLAALKGLQAPVAK